MTNEIMIYINYIVGLQVNNRIFLFLKQKKKEIAYVINKEQTRIRFLLFIFCCMARVKVLHVMQMDVVDEGED